MAFTLGDARFRIAKTPGGEGVDQDYLDSVINEVYATILRSYPWKRLTVTTTLQTTAIYDTGTVAVTNGANTVVLTSGTFTSAMTGRDFRVDGNNEFYTFTFVDATNGTIDRNYEGTTATAGTYRIFKRIYALASTVSVVQSLKVFGLDADLDETDQEQLDEMDASRLTYGRPETFALFDDDASTPPVSQIELWPIPEDAEGLPLRYTKAPPVLSVPSDNILPWVSYECLIAGVKAELGIGSEDKFLILLRAAQSEENRRIQPQQIKMADRFVRHREERAAGTTLAEWRRRNQM